MLLDATLFFVSRSFDSALDVGNVSKRRTKHFLLFGAMRAPVKSVHLCIFRCDALGKAVETAGPFAKSQIIGASNSGNHNNDRQ